MADSAATYATACRWIGFICAIITLGVSGFSIFGSGATLRWSQGKFAEDNPQFRWALFTFKPSKFVDVWSPFVFAIIGILIHIKNAPYKFPYFTSSWIAYMIFHFLNAFFGVFGYAANIGIICGAICCVPIVLCLVAFFVCKDEPIPLGLEIKISMNAKSDKEGPKIYGKVCSWMGLVASVLTFAVGCVRIFGAGAKLKWNKKNFIDNTTNDPEWRSLLFSLNPETFADAWTPWVFTAIGICIHLKQTTEKVHLASRSFLNYFIFMFVNAMWATFGYAGNLGIIFGSYCIVVTALLLVAAIIVNDKPSLLLDASMNFKMKGGGANVNQTVSA